MVRLVKGAAVRQAFLGYSPRHFRKCIMKPAFTALSVVLAASGCVDTGGSIQVVDGVRLTVVTDDGYYWPDPTELRSSGGELVEVEPFPVVTALVVRRSGGAALGEADEALARAAATAQCQDEGKGPPTTSSRLADGTWAFYPCT
jgi:hypothetical protein